MHFELNLYILKIIWILKNKKGVLGSHVFWRLVSYIDFSSVVQHLTNILRRDYQGVVEVFLKLDFENLGSFDIRAPKKT